MTEPIKGSLLKGDWSEFIPSSHVRYLEQTGAKVVAVSYMLQKDTLIALLDQLSGLYFHGDSVEAPTDQIFAETFSHVLAYTFDRNNE
jgi:hypothetical protein